MSWYSPSRPHFFAGMNFKHNFKGGIGVYIKNFMCHCCMGFVQGMVPLKNSPISKLQKRSSDLYLKVVLE